MLQLWQDGGGSGVVESSGGAGRFGCEGGVLSGRDVGGGWSGAVGLVLQGVEQGRFAACAGWGVAGGGGGVVEVPEVEAARRFICAV